MSQISLFVGCKTPTVGNRVNKHRSIDVIRKEEKMRYIYQGGVEKRNREIQEDPKTRGRILAVRSSE